MKIIIGIILLISTIFADCKIIDKQIYKVCFDEELQLPISGKAITYAENIDSGNIKKRPNFYKNSEVKYLKPTEIKMPWHLGHTFAKDSNFDYSQDSLNLTYDMINITPMYGRINVGIWRRVERRGDELTREFGSVEHYTIVEYNKNKLPIYYIRIYKKKDFKECYRVPNHFDNTMKRDLELYKIQCNSIEFDYNIFN